MSPEPRANAPLRLAYAGAALEVSADAAALAWLEEFLTPALASTDAGRAALTTRVALEVLPALHAELESAAETPERDDLEGFTRDGSFTRHATRHGADGTTWARDDEGSIHYGVAPDGSRVRIVAREAGPVARLALMRTLRELATLAALRAGWLPLHGSAFETGGALIAACGPRRSGKTGLLVHALRGGAAFVSNDRLFADVESGRVRAMPTIVMLRDDCVARFPAFDRALARARFDRARTIAECAPGIERPEPRAGKGFDRPGLGPAQLCHLHGAPMTGGGDLAALLLPRIDPTARGIRCRRLAREEALPRLQRSLLRASEPLRGSALFAPAGPPVVSRAEESERCARLLERAQAFDCRLGPDAYGVALVDALPEELFSPSASSRKPSSLKPSGFSFR